MSRRRNSEPTASTSNLANVSSSNNIGYNGYGFDESVSSRNYPGFLASLFDHTPRTYGEALLRWQEEQISTCITENHVNQTVELYMQFSNTNQPIPASYESEFDTVQQTAIMWAMANYGLDLPRMPPIDTDQDTDRAIQATETTSNDLMRTAIEEEAMESNEIEENQQHDFNPNEHHDFMDLAVAAAIQEKGLVVTSKPSNP